MCSLKRVSLTVSVFGAIQSRTAGALSSTSGKEIPGSIAARQPVISTKGQNWGFYDLMKSAFDVLETLVPA